MKKQRKQYAPEEKVAILRRHLLEKEPISKLCDEGGLQPTVFYRWQKEFFENGAAAFEQKARPNHSADHVELAGGDVEPPDEPPGAPIPVLADHRRTKSTILIPRIVRNPVPGQSSPTGGNGTGR
jgi:transposase